MPFLLGSKINTVFGEEELRNPGMFLPPWYLSSLKGKQLMGVGALRELGTCELQGSSSVRYTFV